MGAGFKDFASGAILTAGDVDNYLMRQTVMTFADASARDTALSAVLDEGMVAYLEDTDAVTVYDGSAWNAIGGGGGKILQVAQTVKTDVFSTSTQSNVDVTGLSVSITPSAATSKVLVFATVNHSHATSGGHALKLFRDSTEIGSGSGGAVDGFAGIGDGLATDSIANSSINYLDSPATTSATTYKIVVRVAVGGTAYINRRVAADYWRTSCQITVMEVSA